MEIMQIRKFADKSGGEEARRADLPGAPPGTWPLDHVEITGDVPDEATLSQKLVNQGIGEGWIEAEGHDVVTRPAGRSDAPWDPTPTAPNPHVFHHYEYLTVCGVRYKVVHQPDKYAADGDDDTPVTNDMYAAGATRVDWFYTLKKV